MSCCQRSRLFNSKLCKFSKYSKKYSKFSSYLTENTVLLLDQASSAMLMKSVVFWDVTRRRVVIVYRRFRTTYWSHLHATRVRLRKNHTVYVNTLCGRNAGFLMSEHLVYIVTVLFYKLRKPWITNSDMQLTWLVPRHTHSSVGVSWRRVMLMSKWDDVARCYGST
jgi:hypothetical protein